MVETAMIETAMVETAHMSGKMKIYDWKELAALAKAKSRYYGELYSSVSELHDLSSLPVVDQAAFWEANTIKDSGVLTGPISDGIVFKSGGTTGSPKFSVFSRDEWNAFTAVFGEGMAKIGLATADRVANLFYVGELYASFLFIMKSIEAAPHGAVQFPISGATDPYLVLKTAEEFGINVLAGAPTTIMNVAEVYAREKEIHPDVMIDKILFGGETMYPDQRLRLAEIFPGGRIYSIGYASVDAGLIGYVDESCEVDEHRAFGQATIVEIVDEETLEPIEEPGRPGKVLLTNLVRSLMPIIRYPVGDRAVWVEPTSSEHATAVGARDRKYRLLGRSEEAARVGPVSVYYEDVRAFMAGLDLDVQMSGFQLVIRHYDLKDSLTLRIATSAEGVRARGLDEQIVREFGLARAMFAEAVNDNKIHPLSIEWSHPSQVEINARTGKLKRVIDLRIS